MTEKRSECTEEKKTLITEVLSCTKKKATLRLENSPFRVAGGGQPGDSGTLEGENFRCRVTDCTDDGKGALLEVALQNGTPEEGLAVRALPDLERRFLYSRMHSGEHIFSKVMESMLEGLHVYKVAIGPEESTVSFRYGGEISWDILFRAEEEARKIIAQDREVSVRLLPRGEAEKLPELKANWDRISDEVIRVVDIEDFDCIACSGSHVERTGQVGPFLVVGYNGSAPEWSCRFRVDGDAVEREYGRVMRRLLRHIGCDPEKVEQVVAGLQEENEERAKMLGRARNYLVLPWETFELAPDSTLRFGAFSGFSRDFVSPEVKRCILEHPQDAVLVLLPREEGGGDFLLARGESCGVDCRKAIKEPALQARGGGAPEWVSGRTAVLSPEEWRQAIQAHVVRG